MKQRIAGYQSWRNLLFIHWRVNADAIQALLPDGLTIETFDGAAWVGLVPFSMERVRPWWSPPVPGVSWFLETNVRTYVRHVSGQTGVWFFSLDANHRLAVSVARRFWNLNYVLSDLQLKLDGGQIRCTGNRIHLPDADYNIAAEIDTAAQLTQAAEGSLDHFLLERYHLFARRPDGKFFVGQVHHEPYSYRPVTSLQLKQTMLAANGCDMTDDKAPDHITFSPGVDVIVSPLEAAGC